MEKIFVLDTNVLLNDPYSVLAFNEHKVIIPMTVLEELDNIKGKHTDVSRDARVAIRQISDILGDATHDEIVKGVNLNTLHDIFPDTATLAIYPDDIAEKNGIHIPLSDVTVPDNCIINTAFYAQSVFKDAKVILVTNDINMSIKAKGAGVDNVESYGKDKSLNDMDLLHVGHVRVDDFWKLFENTEVQSEVNKLRRTIHKVPRIKEFNELLINDYVYDDQDALMRLSGKSDTHLYFYDIGKGKALNKKVWGLKSINVEQSMAIDALTDPEIDIVILLGPAGTGKSLLAVAAGLEQTLEKPKFDKIVVTRSQDSQFADIGFLPGTLEEKIGPSLGCVQDALEFLHKDDRKFKNKADAIDSGKATSSYDSIKYIRDRGILKYEALNFIRGRSYSDTLLVIDEAQNLTPQMMKTICTRLGTGSKLVIMGNLAQIDNQYITEFSSGLTYLVEKFKGWEGCAIVQLQATVRSRLAEFAEQNL